MGIHKTKVVQIFLYAYTNFTMLKTVFFSFKLDLQTNQ